MFQRCSVTNAVINISFLILVDSCVLYSVLLQIQTWKWHKILFNMISLQTSDMANSFPVLLLFKGSMFLKIDPPFKMFVLIETKHKSFHRLFELV